MGDQHLLARAGGVLVKPRPGRIGWASFVDSNMVFRQRPRYLKAMFQDLCLRRIGPTRLLRTGKGPSVMLDPGGSPVLAHSLVIELSRNAEKAKAHVRQLADDALKESPEPEFRVEGSVYSACNEGAATWGHWIGHNLPRAMLFLEHVPDGRIIVPEAYMAKASSFLDLMARAGIESSKIVAAPHRCSMLLDDCALIDLPYHEGVFHPILAEKIRHLQPAATHGNNQRHFVPRNSSDRSISNADDIDRVHAQYNVSKAAIDVTSLASQVAAWSSCSTMIGILGSDLSNMAIGRPESVCSITPHWFGDIFFYGLAAILDVEWNEYYCGTKVALREPVHRSTFMVNANDYGAFLKWCLGN